MLRLTEFAMFLAPFAAFLVWRFTAAHGGPSTLVLVLTVLVASRCSSPSAPPSRRSTATEAYVPARIENGSIVPGHGAHRP